MGSTLLIVFLGFVFGSLLSYARLNTFDVISGLALRENFAVLKTLMLAIGTGAVLLSLEVYFGMASYHIKPFVTGGLLLGGLFFGAGMAILGYCPGTLPITLGEGRPDALMGIIGGLVGGWYFTILHPVISPILGPDLGKLSLLQSTGGFNPVFFLILIVISLTLIYFSFKIRGKNEAKNKRWMWSGLGLAILNPIVFATAVSNRPIGASTSFPYVADKLTGLTGNDYFQQIATPGHWEVIFLGGALIAGFVLSLIRKDFGFTLIQDNWKRLKGESVRKRVLWSFLGGFILIFGARMAGGCTSGHILSGDMQLAFSSYLFSIVALISLFITGHLFYKK